MKVLKIYLKTILFFLLVSIVLCLILSLFNVGGIMKTSVTDNIMITFMLILCLLIGIRHGKLVSKKGYIEGLKIGLCLIFFLIFIHLIFYRTNFSLARTIYYLLLLLACIMGSMIGINRKK